MRLVSDSFDDGARIPAEFAFGVPDAETQVSFGANRNPHLAWSEVPEGTQSFAVLCVDADAPTVGDDVNQEGRTVAAALPRADFCHWLLVDLAPGTREIEAGAYAAGVVPHGRSDSGPNGRQGLNDYTDWFAGDQSMEGTYHGYDGPCPPWNDERVHRYSFTVAALDVTSLPLDSGFRLVDVRAAMEGHILAQASIVGTYAIYAHAS